MERIQSPIQDAPRRGGRRPLLTGPAVLELLQRQVAAGASLSQIRDALAVEPPEGLGVNVSRTAIAQRLKTMGLKTSGISILAAASLSAGAEEVARRQVDAGQIRAAARKGQRRVPSWLSRYKTEIGRMIGEGLIYCEIWDALHAANPLEARFAVELSDSAKSARIANFKHREKKKAEGRAGRKARLLQQFGEHQVEAPNALRPRDVSPAESQPVSGFNARPSAAQPYMKPRLAGGRAYIPPAATNGQSRFLEKGAELASASRRATEEELTEVNRRLGSGVAAPGQPSRARPGGAEKNSS